jgi:hypothetical protein
MKKTFLLCFFALLFIQGYSQKVRLGLKFAPGAAFSRVNESNDTLTFGGKGLGLRFVAGPEINFILGQNYVFTTGLWYMSKRSALKIKELNVNQVYNLQYLQLPAILKLYTNDIAVDTKLYFQIGATADIKLQQKGKGLKEYEKYINKFRIYDFSAVVGAGLQLQMGQNTYIYGGITYFRGLMNSISNIQGFVKDGVYVAPGKIQLKNDLLSLDFGIRF